MTDPLEQWMQELLRLTDEENKMTEKQLNILKAAVEVFAEKGYAASSTSEIAQKAGVAEGTIFRHYKTKKDLLVSIVAPTMTRLIAPFVLRDFSKILDAPYARFEDFLRALLQNRIEFLHKHMTVIRIMIQEIPFHPELREPFKEHVARKVIERVSRIVEHFQAQGQIAADIPPLTVMRMSASVLIGYVITRYIVAPELNWNDEQETELCIRFIMNGLRP